MVKLNNLKPAEGSVKKRKRIARGEGSGMAGKATKGVKGQQSRSGYSRKWGHEGGQMPLQKRVPKFGFKNRFRKSYVPVNLDTLQKLNSELNIESINPEVLRDNGLLAKNKLVKILGKGELSAAVEVKAHAFSESARKAIEEKGGTVINI